MRRVGLVSPHDMSRTISSDLLFWCNTILSVFKKVGIGGQPGNSRLARRCGLPRCSALLTRTQKSNAKLRRGAISEGESFYKYEIESPQPKTSMSASDEQHRARSARIWYGLWVVLPVPLAMLVPSYDPHQLVEILWPALCVLLGLVASIWWFRHAELKITKAFVALPFMFYAWIAALPLFDVFSRLLEN